MQSFPGVLTPTECFAALAAGADGLKIFPAFQMGPEGLKAIRAVLPPLTPVYMPSAASAPTLRRLAQGRGRRLRPRHLPLPPRRHGRSDVATRARAMVAAWDETDA
jgi:2-dehydro-3-deoxyphosphogalactonate aldolase